jgi:hypothetical protein
MAKSLPAKIAKQVKLTVYKKADEHGYGSRTRVDNGAFLDALVDDPEVGGVLKEYKAKENIRTYIKDAILNAYAKKRKRELLSAKTATDTVKTVFGVEVNDIQKEQGVTVCQSNDNRFFVVSEGTVLKWETSLRKALELIAREPGLIMDGMTPAICLQLADISASITDGDKKHITTALDAIFVKARFCSG